MKTKQCGECPHYSPSGKYRRTGCNLLVTAMSARERNDLGCLCEKGKEAKECDKA